jgi:hypothetical protein
MSRELDRVRNAIVPVDEQDRADFPVSFSRPAGFVTFRYSSTEVFSQGGNLHVKMKETRYQDGRLTSEECEGTLDRQAYNQMVHEAQGYFLNQMAGFVKLFFAPFSGRR